MPITSEISAAILDRFGYVNRNLLSGNGLRRPTGIRPPRSPRRGPGRCYIHHRRFFHILDPLAGSAWRVDSEDVSCIVFQERGLWSVCVRFARWWQTHRPLRRYPRENQVGPRCHGDCVVAVTEGALSRSLRGLPWPECQRQALAVGRAIGLRGRDSGLVPDVPWLWIGGGQGR